MRINKIKTNLKRKNEGITKCSSNKGFSSNSSILPRSNFGSGGQESSPQSLTAATLNRTYVRYKDILIS